MKAGTLDLMVASVRLSDPLIAHVVLHEEELLLVGATGHHWHPEEDPLLAYAEDLPLFRKYWKTAFQRNPGRKAAVVVPDLRALKGLVCAAAGITVLPRYLIAQELQAGVLEVLHRPSMPVTNVLSLVWRKNEGHPRVIHVRDQLLSALKGSS